MLMIPTDNSQTLAQLKVAADGAARALPPVWPLASSVAVNPYLGQTGLTLAETAALMARVSGTPVTMPRQFYREKLASRAITEADLAAALGASPHPRKPATLAALQAAIAHDPAPMKAIPTVADLAAKASGIDWPGVIAERFGAWAGGYFDQGQALWAAPRGKGAYAVWQAVASHDLTPEIAGLTGFGSFVADAPERAAEALASAVAAMQLPSAALETYFHSLLVTLGGWAHVARYELWQAELAGRSDETITDFLTIRLLWEQALLTRYGSEIGQAWLATIAAHEEPVEPTADQIIDAILQEAAERAGQSALAETLSAPLSGFERQTPVLQAAFCIDVRSEVFRRALESLDRRIQTLGFAGFFGLTASHQRYASDVHEHRLPVLLNAGLTSRTGGEGATDARHTARAARAWGRFKLAAVSSFAFVEAAGPIYIGKLVKDALGLKANKPPRDPKPFADPAPDTATRVGMAASILGAMSLTTNFAPLVLLAGHGANVVNNPHASGLHCGACGGYSGEVNARLLAGLLNDPEVRTGLIDKGIVIPQGTLFIAALHDTTTDAVTLYTEDQPIDAHRDAIAQAEQWLAAAAVLTRSERALRLPRAGDDASVIKRSRDWSETRAEWALAGCKAFIAAPRQRTAGRSLEGRAFLHDYIWRRDEGFGVLELIMTAPVVVASWISLQYYGSSVAPQLFGGGNKLLHNVVGGIGVIEGNGGPLRAGLPWQSVHDGHQLMHEPLRLSVCIEAPREAMTTVLEKHAGVRALFDNKWLHLFAIDDEGKLAWRYAGDLKWEPTLEAFPTATQAEMAI
ncbi:DUF2309 domain-containing protein [Novosphingobium sp.]|uniref:YbcC family protein n=1 Tax=Novosphingobium sp. TaxID=1874826 RepID=UPI00260349D7|nr:DUF2309 domain-containing protein [Novosphingobium sp.]